jgi:hypothetical protein
MLQWHVFHMVVLETRSVSVFSIDTGETQSSLIGFRSLLEALCLRNRTVLHELLMGIRKLFFRIPSFWGALRPDSG